jgi:hypothetical protein
LLGIELPRNRGRAHQVTEKHRQMPTLASWTFASFNLHTNWRGAVEWGGAPRAKPRLGSVI